MPEEEILDFQEKIDRGLQLAEERMLQEKALHDECVIVQTMDGPSSASPPNRSFVTCNVKS